MKLTRILVLIVLVSTTALSFSYADDYTRWELPEGAKLRLGKGKIKYVAGGNPFKFSPDSSKLFVFTSIGIWVYEVQTGKELRLVTKHTKKGDDYVILNPDCRTFVDIHNSAAGNQIELWDLQTGEVSSIFDNRDVKIKSVAYQPDGKKLVSGDSDGVVRIWNIDTGENRVFQSVDKSVGSVAWSPDGQTILGICDHEVRLWNADDGRIKTILDNTQGIYRINFTPDSKLLIGETPIEIRIWDAESGDIKIKLEYHGSNKQFALSHDSKSIAIAERDDTSVRLLDIHNGELKKTFIGDFLSNRIESIVFSPDGQIIAAAGYGGIWLGDIVSGRNMAILKGPGLFYHLMFSPNGRTLAAYSYPSRHEVGIYLWNIDITEHQKSMVHHIIKGHKLDVNSIAFSPEGQSIAVGYRRKNIRLWDASTGKLQKVFRGHPNPLWLQSISFSPNGDTLASLSNMHIDKASIYLWDVETGEYMTTLGTHGKSLGRSHAYQPSGIAFSPDGKTLVSGSVDGTIRFWNAKYAVSHSLFDRFWSRIFGYQKGVINQHQDYVLSVAFSPDGSTLATGSSDKTVMLWDVRRRKQKAILTRVGIGRINCVAFSPDGNILASVDSKGKIYIWDLITKKHIATLVDDPHVISGNCSIAFSPDGSTLACGSTTRMSEQIKHVVFLWDMKTHQLKATFNGHNDFIITVGYSPDGRTLASGSTDGTVLIWEIPD